MKMPRSGGTPATLASNLDFPSSLAVDVTSVYWTNGGSSDNSGTVMKMDLNGNNVVTLKRLDIQPVTAALEV